MLPVTTILDRIVTTLYIRFHPDEGIKINNLTPNLILLRP